MRSILEQAVIHHLSGNADKAQELFHQFIVARARQIHESMRNGESVTEGFEDEELVTEEFFSEDDLAKLEDSPVEDEGADEFALGGEADEAGDAADNVDDAMGDMDDAMGDMDDVDDNGVDDGEDGALESRIEDLEAELERLAAEFETLQGEDGEGDEFADDVADADDLEDDMGDGVAEEDPAMAAGADEHQMHESEGDDMGDDDFDDIAESLVNELEKISFKPAQGKTVADGASFTQNTTSNLPQKKVGQRDGAKPTSSKQSQHKGYERETPPSVTTLKKRRNNVDHADSALSLVGKTDTNPNNKGVGTGKNSNVTHANNKSAVVPTKGVVK
jgi:hypothetical protein